MTALAGSGPVVEVLLSTFEGATYLPAFLCSLAGQTHAAWRLLARDDGSADSSSDLLAAFATAHPGRVRLLVDAAPVNLGVAAGFSRLLAASAAPYVAFADQDDVWRPEKIAITLAALRGREAVAPGAAVLAHTDLQVANADLSIRAPSFWRYQGIVPSRGRPVSRMLVENIVCGCTAMLNRSLVERVGEIPAEARLHDWWVALVAAAFGEIVSLDAAPILWRRHGGTETDITDLLAVLRGTVSDAPAMRQRVRALLAAGRPRARLFLERYGSTLRAADKAAVEAFLQLGEGGALARRLSLVRHDLRFTSRLRTAGLLALV